MRPGALIPALAFGAALLAPPAAHADQHRSPERGRRSGYERSVRSQGRFERGHSRRSYRRDQPRRSYRRGHPGNKRGDRRPAYRYRRPYDRPRHPRYVRPYHRPRYRSYPRPYYRPYPRPYYHGYYRTYRRYPAPGPPPYGPWPRHRGGVHGHVAIGLPFVGFSLFF
jgi:hypothetical protein